MLITIYSRIQKLASVPVSNPRAIVNVAHVPYDVMDMIRNYATGISPIQSKGIWSWEWQHENHITA
jgi:hypothetical protein